MSSEIPKEVLNIAKIIGNLIQHWGFKKIHGQIWTLVFLSKTPLNSTLLTRHLRVSKALISLAIKDLLKYRVIEVIEKKKKEIFFRSNPEIFMVIQDILKGREKVMLEQIQHAHEELCHQMPVNGSAFDVDTKKLEEMGKMIEAANETLTWLSSSLAQKQ